MSEDDQVTWKYLCTHCATITEMDKPPGTVRCKNPRCDYLAGLIATTPHLSERETDEWDSQIDDRDSDVVDTARDLDVRYVGDQPEGERVDTEHPALGGKGGRFNPPSKKWLEAAGRAEDGLAIGAGILHPEVSRIDQPEGEPRYLSPMEQKVFARAQRRSVKIVGKPDQPEGELMSLGEVDICYGAYDSIPLEDYHALCNTARATLRLQAENDELKYQLAAQVELHSEDIVDMNASRRAVQSTLSEALEALQEIAGRKPRKASRLKQIARDFLATHTDSKPDQPEGELMSLEEIDNVCLAAHGHTDVIVRRGALVSLQETARAAHRLQAENEELEADNNQAQKEMRALDLQRLDFEGEIEDLRAQLSQAVEVIKFADNNLVRNHPVWQKCDDFLATHNTDEVGDHQR